MACIKAFPGTVDPGLPRDEQPVAEVISELESMLADARSGELRAFACAVVTRGNQTTYGWARGRGQTAHELAAAIGDLAFMYSLDRYETRNQKHPMPSMDDPA